MQANVPQYLDIEDKIVGPLTAKQLGWLAMGGVIMLVFWNFLDTSAFIIAAIIIAAICGAFAFYRPYNLPLIKFLTNSVYFVMRPKIYIWKRLPDDTHPLAKSKAKKAGEIYKRKKVNVQKIGEIGRMLDQNK